jgi:hypothetical protein
MAGLMAGPGRPAWMVSETLGVGCLSETHPVKATRAAEKRILLFIIQSAAHEEDLTFVTPLKATPIRKQM